MRNTILAIFSLSISALFAFYFYVQVGFTAIVRGDEWYHWFGTLILIYLSASLLFRVFSFRNLLLAFLICGSSFLVHSNSQVALKLIMLGAVAIFISPIFLIWKIKYSNLFTLLMFLFFSMFLLSNFTTSVIGLDLYFQLKREPVIDDFVYPSLLELVTLNWHWIMFTFWTPIVLMLFAVARISGIETNNPLLRTRKKPLAVE